MKRPYLLDSSFVIDLLNETAAGLPGSAYAWLRRHPRGRLFISAVTYDEVLEGAQDEAAVRRHLNRYRWQGLHRAEAELAARLQRRATRRLGENDAWQVAVTLCMGGILVGHDPKAFGRLGEPYEDHRVGPEALKKERSQ
jgi:predicted nucleic acid-binding protein